ncbi:MAG TPA: ATP-binding protein [Longimicrobiales bacterium]|nr:ATP-binding protein [Longimicrobiales bacterium]
MVIEANDAGSTSPADAAERDDRARVSSREALRFLTRAGRVLSASLQPDQTLQGLMRLAIPRVACFAAIDLLCDDGSLERLAHAHIDDARDPLLEKAEPFRPEEEGLDLIAQALHSRKPILIEDTSRSWEGDAATHQQVSDLGGRSIIIVPLAVHGRILGVITLGSTRTDRHYDRQDLSLAEELARTAALALDNARLYQRAEHAIAARDEVLAIVSHDLRNPVNRVRMAAELMLERDDVPETERMAGIVIRAADEMNRLIGDLLDVSRIEAGRLSIECAPVDVALLLDRIDESYAAAAIEKTLRWSVNRPSTRIGIEADEARMLQALGNLIGNAIKFTPEGGEVSVSVEGFTDRVHIVVSDTGPGMTTEQLAHVFDRFWQARQGDRAGAGLGLAIARGIVEAHGGTLEMKSEPGTGTRAIMELPCARGCG